MTNETITSILERRSVRKYLPDMIKDEELQAIIECGLWAPSGSDTQAWHITVIRDKAMMQKLNLRLKDFVRESGVQNRYAERIVKPDFNVFCDPPVLLLVSYDGAAAGKWGETNASLLVENMCIAAQSLSIGSLQVGMIYDMMQHPDYGKPLCDELGVPEGYTPHLFVSLGYQDTSVRTVKKPRREGTVNYYK